MSLQTISSICVKEAMKLNCLDIGMMKGILVVISLILVLLLTGCSGSPAPTPALAPTPAPAPAPATPPQEPNPPLNVRLDYIGIRNAYDHDDSWDRHSEVQLIVVASDGKTATQQDEVFIPRDKKGYKMGNFKSQEINQPVFYSDVVGDYLRVSIAAWDIDSKEETINALDVLEALGVAGAGELKGLYSMLPEEDDRIADYSHTWHRDQDWGIGQHEEVLSDNFMIGFSIWSNKEPPPVLALSLIPDVSIQKMVVPPKVRRRSEIEWVYIHTDPINLTFINNEPVDMEVEWEVACKAGEFYFGGFSYNPITGKEIIPAHGSRILEVQYSCEVVGADQVTCKISYEGKELDSKTGIIDVAL